MKRLYKYKQPVITATNGLDCNTITVDVDFEIECQELSSNPLYKLAPCGKYVFNNV